MLRKIYSESPLWLKNLFIEAFRKKGQIKFLLNKKSFINHSCLSRERILLYNKQRKYGPRPYLCYAPFTGMFFSRIGKMAPCYASYGYKSDKWPHKSIHESWFNGEFEAIRQEMKNGNLNYACKFCKPLFDSADFGSLLPNKYEPYGIGKLQYPKIMEFELSNRCNLECVMCDGNLSSSIRKNRDKLPPVEDNYNEKFVQELEEFIPHLQMAEFTGGDPFLIPIYYDIWEKIEKINPNCDILITTNANTMSERIEKMLATFQNLHFNISLDSLDKSNYEQIRKNAEFEKVIANTHKFIEYCKIHKTSCNILVCPLTINSRDFKDIIEFANRNDICVYFHTVIKPENLSLKFQSKEYLDDLTDFLNQYQAPEKTKKQKINAENYRNLIHLLESWKNDLLHVSDMGTALVDVDTILTNLKLKLSIDAWQKLIKLTKVLGNEIDSERLLGVLQNVDYKELEHILLNFDESEIQDMIKKYV